MEDAPPSLLICRIFPASSGLVKTVKFFARIAQPQTSMFGGLATTRLGRLVSIIAGKNQKSINISAIVSRIPWLPQPVTKPSAHPPKRPLFPNRQQFVSSPRRFGNGAFVRDEKASVFMPPAAIRRQIHRQLNCDSWTTLHEKPMNGKRRRQGTTQHKVFLIGIRGIAVLSRTVALFRRVGPDPSGGPRRGQASGPGRHSAPYPAGTARSGFGVGST